MAEARARILTALTAQLDGELERIAADAESRGYIFPDTAPKAGQHLRWLFEHVAHGTTYPELAKKARPAVTPWSVANTANRYADLLGVRLA
jgi:hypothetical protein